MGHLRSNGGRSWGTRDVSLHGRITIVARVRPCGPFIVLLAQAEWSPWVAGELRMLLAERLGIVRIVFNEENEEGCEDEGEPPGAEEGYEVPESCRERRGRGEVRLDHRGRGL